MDPANTYVEKKASKRRNAMGTEEFRICFEKFQNFQLFVTKTARKKFLAENIAVNRSTE